MRKLLLISGAFAIMAITYKFFAHTIIKKNQTPAAQQQPVPTEGEENEKLRELYNELRHRTAPGVSWREMEKNNMQQLATSIQSRTATANFANGAVTGIWHERGANNLTGSVRAVDYVPQSNTLYTVSNGGSLWSTTLGSGNWTLQNQFQRFEPRAVKAFTKIAGGERILLASGTSVYYSDNNGQALIPATGIVFPVAWGGNHIAGIYRLNDGSNNIYCLVRVWSNDPAPLWASRYQLYMSTDQGQSYTKIYQFDTGADESVSVCNPYNNNQIFITEVGTAPGVVKLYNATGNMVSLVNSFTIAGSNNKCTLKGTFVGGVNHLYLLLNNNKIYYSTDLGANWGLQSTLTENAWDKMNVSMSDPLKISYGAINAYRSSNGGASFTKVNDWSEYYSNVSSKLHADIMEIEYFKKTDNTEFAIINTHGGTYISYDNLVTVSNQSLNGHIAVEVYDVLTDTLNTNRIFAGSQDQGLQRTLTATTPGIRDFTQVISGDYGQLCLTNNNNFLWAQYPGGVYYLYNNLGGVANPSYLSNWTTPGTEKPNYGWMIPSTSTANTTANEIWLGGGNLLGGGGSYLIKAVLPLTPPYDVTATQFNYNFRANSNSGANGISAVEQSLLNPDKLFVATEDGTFFYSNDLGITWNKTAAFNGPGTWYLYGSCILASRLNSSLIWYSGSGYSNPGVFKSVDGGVTFSPMTNGLPGTLVNEIVASPDEKFIFAATEAGPYVYVVADNTWYSLADNTVPVQFFSSVEYIRSENIVRFGTMGRGVWDFQITSALPVTLTEWQAQKQNDVVLCTWKTEQESNSSYFMLERSTNGVDFTELAKVPAAGYSASKLSYSYIDKSPVAGINYYRLKSVDIDNKTTLSNVISVSFDGIVKKLQVYPNPARDILFIETNTSERDDLVVKIIDMSGRVLMYQKRKVTGQSSFSINISTLSKGNYILSVKGNTIDKVQQIIKE